ncbi:MAG: RsmE family RNA methyltransferase [Candidatus Kryptoniota bacterium]
MEEFIVEDKESLEGAYKTGKIIISGEEHFHLSRVLRMRRGEKILVTDGRGLTFRCEVESITGSHTIARIINFERWLNASKREYAIAIAFLSTASKLEFALEKCTELGAREFVIFKSERSEGNRVRVDRLSRIIRSAVKQSLQCYIPVIHIADNLSSVRKISDSYKLRFVMDAAAGEKLDEKIKQLPPEQSVIAVIGPEGGLTEHEVGFFDLAGFERLSLGNSRLRSETAAIKTSSLLAVY